MSHKKYLPVLSATAVIAIILVFLSVGCSGKNGNIVSPDYIQSIDSANRPVANPDLPPIDSLPVIDSAAVHNFAGVWSVRIDPVSLQTEIIPVREGMNHFNVTKFVDGPPLNLGVSVNPADSDPLNGLIDCMVTLTNPFAVSLTNLCGFDVRGLLLTEGSTPLGGLQIASLQETRLLNADGHTRWWNPTEFPGSGLLGFTPGNLAPPDYSMITATLNPYKYFADVLDVDDPVSETLSPTTPSDEYRGIFKAGQSNTRRYTIQFPSDGSGFDLIFNYAVDISWAPPTVHPPVTLPDDFPIEANSPEPFLVEVDAICNTLWYTDATNRGGELFLNIRVSDWKGYEAGDITAEIDQIRVECPGVFAGTILAERRWENSDYAHYILDVGDFGIPIGAGEYPLLVSVVSADGSYDQGFPSAFPSGPVTAYKLIYVTVDPAINEPYTLPFADDMGPNTVDLWDVENGPGHFPPGGSQWAYHTDHWGTSDSLTDNFEKDMETYLISPELVVPGSGTLTVRYSRAMDATTVGGTAGGQVMYRINGGSWSGVGGFFDYAVQEDEFGDPIPSTGQNPSLSGLTPGDTIEIGFLFTSDSSTPDGFGYHVWRVVVQEYEALEVDKLDYPQFLGNVGTSYNYQIAVTNTSPLPNHQLWWGVDWVADDTFFSEEGGETYNVNFPMEGKYWVATNAYLRTPVEWLVTGVAADIDVYSYTPTSGAFFTDDFNDNSNGWDLTTGADGNGNFMQIRDDGTGWLDNRQGESGCYGETADGTPTTLPEKIAEVSVAIPGAAGDDTKTFLRLYHRFFMYPQDTVRIRINGIEIFTGDGMHYQCYDPYLFRFGWGWFDSLLAPNLEVQESVICIGDDYNGSLINLQLVSSPKNEFPNCNTDIYTFGWQVDYLEMSQTSNPITFFREDFNRGIVWSEGYTYPYDLTGGDDVNGNFWNIVPDVDPGYLTNVQIATGCWNGTNLADVNNKEARIIAFFPHTTGPTELVIRHRFNTDSEGERMHIQLGPTTVIPTGGFIYNGVGNYWTGSSGGWVESTIALPAHPFPGGIEEIRFVSIATDEFDNCEGSGLSGWQIDWLEISD